MNVVRVFYRDGGWYYEFPGISAKGPFDSPVLAQRAAQSDIVSQYERVNDVRPGKQP